MADIPRRVALVYDRVTKWGGAERVLLDLHQLFPEAELFTAIYEPQSAPWASVFPLIHTSFLNKFSFIRHHHEWFPFLMPLAFERFDFDAFDLVISITSAEAKGILTKPSTRHICYCLTPTRYLYTTQYKIPLFAKPLLAYLKYWDQIACYRPDAYISISQTVQSRVHQFYHQSSSIVYPAVPTLSPAAIVPGEYFLIVSRLVEQKNMSELIKLFNQLKLPLVIVGTGKLERRLKKLAQSNIAFTGLVSDQKLSQYYSRCKALIYFHEEDFGLVPLEAQLFGKPVLALSRGGATETVIHGTTGLLLNSLTDLSAALVAFDHTNFNPQHIKQHAQTFNLSRFKEQFLSELGKL